MTEDPLTFIVAYLGLGASFVMAAAGCPKNAAEWIAATGITLTWPFFLVWGLVLAMRKGRR